MPQPASVTVSSALAIWRSFIRSPVPAALNSICAWRFCERGPHPAPAFGGTLSRKRGGESQRARGKSSGRGEEESSFARSYRLRPGRIRPTTPFPLRSQSLDPLFTWLPHNRRLLDSPQPESESGFVPGYPRLLCRSIPWRRVPTGRAISSSRSSRARSRCIPRPQARSASPSARSTRVTGNRLRQQLVDEVTREPVESADKGRGYEVRQGRLHPGRGRGDRRDRDREQPHDRDRQVRAARADRRALFRLPPTT